MIKTFKCKQTEKIYNLESSKRFPKTIHQRAYIKLLMLHNSGSLEDLRVPPANRLEKLAGNRSHQYSIRINEQWRLCFKWDNNDAYEVEIVDYH